jgi:hypothetical protein
VTGPLLAEEREEITFAAMLRTVALLTTHLTGVEHDVRDGKRWWVVNATRRSLKPSGQRMTKKKEFLRRRNGNRANACLSKSHLCIYSQRALKRGRASCE